MIMFFLIMTQFLAHRAKGYCHDVIYLSCIFCICCSCLSHSCACVTAVNLLTAQFNHLDIQVKLSLYNKSLHE